MNDRVCDRVARGFFIAALMLFVVMNAVPFSESVYFAPPVDEIHALYGWEIWPEVIPDLVDLDNMSLESKGPSFAWVLGAGMVVASPFLVRPLSMNRVIWWCMMLASGLIVLGLTGVLGWMLITDPFDPTAFRPRAGLFILLTYPVVHFLGVLCVRRRMPEDPSSALAPRGGEP